MAKKTGKWNKPTTPDQLHKIRVAAAKKAAKTRRANIPQEVKKAQAQAKRAKTLEKKRKQRMEEAYQRNLAAKRQTEKFKKRSEAAKKGWESRRAIDRGMKVIKAIRQMLDNWTPQPYWSEVFTAVKQNDKNALQALLDNAISTYGEKEVAKRLDKDADLNMDSAEAICYDSDQGSVSRATAHLTAVLNSGPMDAEQSKNVAEQFTKEEWAEAQAELDFLLR